MYVLNVQLQSNGAYSVGKFNISSIEQLFSQECHHGEL